ncbi:MAG TPA: MurR/RpiR family transcriptional regulator [Steroidobacteraceae bacterium]
MRAGSAIARIKAASGSMGKVSQRIANFIIANAPEVIHMSVSELAERTKASEGAVIKFCKALGATGYQQLKILLAQEIHQPIQFIHEDLEYGDTPAQVIEKTFSSNVNALRDTLSSLDVKAMKAAVKAISSADRVEIYGIGSAASVAEDTYYRMLRIGIDCRLAVDSHIQAISASLTGPRVTTLTISHSGSTHETLAATRLAKEAGARTICITNYGKSPIQKYADIVLTTMARETRFRTEAMTSRIAQLAVVDALIACLALANYKKAVKTIQRTFEVLSIKRL